MLSSSSWWSSPLMVVHRSKAITVGPDHANDQLQCNTDKAFGVTLLFIMKWADEGVGKQGRLPPFHFASPRDYLINPAPHCFAFDNAIV